MIPPAQPPFVFIPIPHAGGNGLAAALSGHLPGRSAEEFTGPGVRRLLAQHTTLADCTQNCGPSFALVRNPWDWAVAAVAYFRQSGHPLFAGSSWRDGLLRLAACPEAEIVHHGLSSQVSSLCGKNGHPAVTWVGRYEQMEENIAEICARLGLPVPALGAVESSPDYRELYDDETRELIGQRYSLDAEVLGYDFDGLRADAPRGLLTGTALRERWLGWLDGNGLSRLGWRQEEPAADETHGDHSQYGGLKAWGWYLDDAGGWLRHFRSELPVKALEIGAFDGVSAAMMLDLLFMHPQSEVHTVDPYLPDPTTPEVNEGVRMQFEKNRLIGGYGERITLHDGLSAEVLAWMISTDGFWESFDFIYVDGSHMAKDVFIDAALSWNLLKPGGVIGFDDYEWGDPAFPHSRPQAAIKAFEEIFGDRIALLFGGSRRFYRKLRS